MEYIILLFYKTRFINEEVNGTDPSPSVIVLSKDIGITSYGHLKIIFRLVMPKQLKLIPNQIIIVIFSYFL